MSITIVITFYYITMNERRIILTFGENIKQLREKDGYSQGELAKLVDIPQSLLWKYEHNVAVPSVLNATKLAKFFHITVEQLIKKED